MKRRRLASVIGAAAALLAALTVTVSAQEALIGKHSFDGGTDNGGTSAGAAINIIANPANSTKFVNIAADTADSTNYVLNVTKGGWGVYDQWRMTATTATMSNAWQGDKYRIEFDFRQNTAGKLYTYFSKSHMYGSGLNIFSFNENSAVGFGDEGGSANTGTRVMAEGVLEKGKWYHYTFELDITAKTAKATVTDGTNTWSTEEVTVSREYSGWWGSSITTPFATLNFLSPGANVDLDNIEFYKIINPLEVTSATMNADEAVEVVFNYAIDEDTAAGITLTDVDGKAVACEGSLSEDGLTYTLTPSGVLAPGSYTVTVATTVTSADRFARTLETEYTSSVSMSDVSLIGYHPFDNGLDNGRDSINVGGTGVSIKQDTDGNYYLSAHANDWNATQWIMESTSKAMRDVWASDKIKVEFDIRYNPNVDEETGAVSDDGKVMVYFSQIHKYRNGLNIFSVTNGNVGFLDEGGSGDARIKSDGLTPGEWYHYEFVLDTVNKTGYAVLTDGTNTWQTDEVSVATTGSYVGWWQTGTVTPFSTICFCAPRAGVDLDNVKFSKVYSAPTVTADGITLSADGEEQAVWTAVSPLTNTIAIDFGTDMKTKTLTNNVYVTYTDENGTQKVASTGSYADGVYTMTLTDMPLAAKTKYTLHIGADAANIVGAVLGEDCEFDFTTADGVMTAELVSVTKDGAEITAFADFSGEVEINVDYTNSTMQDKEFYVIVSQYSSDSVLKKVEFVKVTKTADITAEAVTIDYTVPAADGATSAKVMVWDGIATIRPLSSSIAW